MWRSDISKPGMMIVFLFALGLDCVSATQTASANQKRGFVADGGDCDTPALLNRSSWYYAYNSDDPYRKPKQSGGDCKTEATTYRKRFTPMSWCLSGLNAAPPKDISREFFMGFNEPNNRHNCNTSAEKVAKAWGMVMKLYPDSQLVSPATAGDGIEWYEHFFSNCSKMYGDKGCRLSHLATHDYSCDPETTLGYLKELHEKFKLPIWLTEFSCGDHARGRPNSAHIKYMKAVLPMLDKADFVYRYSWMSVYDSAGKRGLVENDGKGGTQLTELGRIWNA